MAENLLENLPDADISTLVKEEDRFNQEDANQSSAWLRTESRFGATKFSVFKKSCKVIFASPSPRTSHVPPTVTIPKLSSVGTTATSGNSRPE